MKRTTTFLLTLAMLLGAAGCAKQSSPAMGPTLASVPDEGTIFQGEDFVGLVARCSSVAGASPVIGVVVQRLAEGDFARLWVTTPGGITRMVSPFAITMDATSYRADAFGLVLDETLGIQTPARISLTVDQQPYEQSVTCSQP